MGKSLPTRRRCDVCKKFFQAKTNAKYCDHCKPIAKKQVKKESAKRLLSKTINEIKLRPNGKFRDKYGNIYENKQCVICEKIKMMRPETIFCSLKCIWASRHSESPSNQCYNHGRKYILQKCPQCNEQKFIGAGGKYCSLKCSAEARKFHTPETILIRKREWQRRSMKDPKVRSRHNSSSRKFKKKYRELNYQIGLILKEAAKIKTSISAAQKEA